MAAADDRQAGEISGIIQAIRDRIRAGHPSGIPALGNVPLPDLMPVLHARDRAEAKVAAIGSVNPRPPGLVNSIVQSVKRNVARALDWHVREQVEFNRATVDSISALLDAMNEVNRTMASTAAEISGQLAQWRQEASELRDVRSHWSAWREEWERKLTANEIQFLRSVSDLQGAFQHRLSMTEVNLRDIAKGQHADFTASLQRATEDIQQRLWKDLDQIRAEYERLIHNELRTLRQKPQTAPSLPPAQAVAQSPSRPVTGSQVDWLRFADRFRGSYEHVKSSQSWYVALFAGRKNVLDIGCGRGEFLELMKEAGVSAKGIDLSEESVAMCRERGFEAEIADLFDYLRNAPAASLDGIFCSQVIEHLPPDRLPEMIALAAEALARDGVIALETPNPECLAIFATHFYIDPTHTRPVPASLLAFYLEEAGFGRIEIRRLSPAVETMPSVAELPEDFRKAFFGGLDYCALARKL